MDISDAESDQFRSQLLGDLERALGLQSAAETIQVQTFLSGSTIVVVDIETSVLGLGGGLCTLLTDGIATVDGLLDVLVLVGEEVLEAFACVEFFFPPPPPAPALPPLAEDMTAFSTGAEWNLWSGLLPPLDPAVANATQLLETLQVKRAIYLALSDRTTPSVALSAARHALVEAARAYLLALYSDQGVTPSDIEFVLRGDRLSYRIFRLLPLPPPPVPSAPPPPPPSPRPPTPDLALAAMRISGTMSDDSLSSLRPVFVALLCLSAAVITLLLSCCYCWNWFCVSAADGSAAGEDSHTTQAAESASRGVATANVHVDLGARSAGGPSRSATPPVLSPRVRIEPKDENAQRTLERTRQERRVGRQDGGAIQAHIESVRERRRLARGGSATDEVEAHLENASLDLEAVTATIHDDDSAAALGAPSSAAGLGSNPSAPLGSAATVSAGTPSRRQAESEQTARTKVSLWSHRGRLRSPRGRMWCAALTLSVVILLVSVVLLPLSFYV